MKISCLLVLSVALVTPVASLAQTTPRGRDRVEDSAEPRTLAVVAAIQRADYEGDLAALRRLHAELKPLPADPRVASRILYWRGFALWRRAINAFNEPRTDLKETEEDLQEGVREFEEALRRDPQFHDATVGLISCLGYLTFVNRQDPAKVQALVDRWVPLTKATREIASENPRFLWVLGQHQWYTLPGMTQSQIDERQAAALAIYQRGLELARQQKGMVKDPLDPAWGEPELLMNLGWANLNRTRPDIAAAEQHARAALALVPYWHYVGDILVPQIEQAKNKRE